MENALVQMFEATPVTVTTWDGKLVFDAGDVSTAIGYTRRDELADRVSSDWARDFTAGKDFVRLGGPELKAYKEAYSTSREIPGLSDSAIEVDRRKSVLLLTERGVQMAAILARTDKGRAFRDWIVDVAVPRFLGGGAVTPPSVSAKQPPQLAAPPDPDRKAGAPDGHRYDGWQDFLKLGRGAPSAEGERMNPRWLRHVKADSSGKPNPFVEWFDGRDHTIVRGQNFRMSVDRMVEVITWNASISGLSICYIVADCDRIHFRAEPVPGEMSMWRKRGCPDD